MKLIADCGATKSNWAILREQGVKAQFAYTAGFTPFSHTKEEIASILSQNGSFHKYGNQITELHFFGAGCKGKANCNFISDALATAFPKALISVKSDLWAAIRSTCGEQEGLVCVLGTGSNACFFDGKEIHQKTRPLGFILGDEGSGAYFGKQLLKQVFYRKLPSELYSAFRANYRESDTDILNKIYHTAHPKPYIASFCRFLSGHQEHHFIKDMILNGFLEYFDTHICVYEDYENKPVHVIGSIGHYFNDLLKEAAQKRNIQLGKIVDSPIYELVNYFSPKPFTKNQY